VVVILCGVEFDVAVVCAGSRILGHCATSVGRKPTTRRCAGATLATCISGHVLPDHRSCCCVALDGTTSSALHNLIRGFGVSVLGWIRVVVMGTVEKSGEWAFCTKIWIGCATSPLYSILL
jgi:hypothetical protein